MALLSQFDGLVPIWGIQREKELDEWLSFMDETPALDDELRAFIAREQKELMGSFCRGCGYCMPCTVGIVINQCNRMSLMIRRAPSAAWLDEHWQAEMAKIDSCVDCRQCVKASTEPLGHRDQHPVSHTTSTGTPGVRFRDKTRPLYVYYQ